MKRTLFPRLAWLGIRKNHRLYVPYILTAVGMVMMSYIIHSLTFSPSVAAIPHDGDIRTVLGLGKFVIAIFALLFLFYTNTFLIRRRNKEFGLYNILGMDKRGICRVVFWENLFVALISIAAGLFLGVVFSKLAELGLLNAVHSEVGVGFSIPIRAIALTAAFYGAIFLVLFLRSVFDVLRSRPTELLKSESVGEKPPKANWIMALIGAGLLGGAYYLAVTIESPLTALVLFFVAVIMVIIATYLLFMAGSVTLCRILQKNKRYYYQKDHFVSTSSMAYRMKRNGAGLASICILSTMVLVMISSTSSLYFGANDAIKARFPRENEIAFQVDALDKLNENTVGEMREVFEETFRAHGVKPSEVNEYIFASIAGMQQGAFFEADAAGQQFNAIQTYDNIRILYFIALDDYNAVMGTSYSLREGETMIAALRCQYEEKTLAVGELSLTVAGKCETMPLGEASSQILPSVQIIVPDYETLRPLEKLTYDASREMLLEMSVYYGYDLADTGEEETVAVYKEAKEKLMKVDTLQYMGDGCAYSGGCLAAEKEDFFTTFGGLFFLGILLSIVFIFGAVMIIYYKQVSEGYEDQARFAILQKVGMSHEDVKKSIDSQVLTVFFTPLLMAGIHLAFAYPLIWKILMLFNLHNLRLVILVTVGAFLLFGLFYAVIYRVTARAYYGIVLSGEKNA